MIKPTILARALAGLNLSATSNAEQAAKLSAKITDLEARHPQHRQHHAPVHA